MIKFTPPEIATMLDSIEYSKQRVRDAIGTPHEVRQEKLAQLDACQKTLRQMRDSEE